MYLQTLRLLLYTVGLWAALHTFIVVIEEPQLERRFGEEYETFMREVPRWVPRLVERSERNGPDKSDNR